MPKQVRRNDVAGPMVGNGKFNEAGEIQFENFARFTEIQGIEGAT
jgi:hypothetical protein